MCMRKRWVQVRIVDTGFKVYFAAAVGGLLNHPPCHLALSSRRRESVDHPSQPAQLSLQLLCQGQDRLRRPPLLFLPFDRRDPVACLRPVVTELRVVPTLDQHEFGARR